MFVAFPIHLHDLSHNLLHIFIAGVARNLPLRQRLQFIDLRSDRFLLYLNSIYLGKSPLAKSLAFSTGKIPQNTE